jgi:hypothetical protein
MSRSRIESLHLALHEQVHRLPLPPRQRALRWLAVILAAAVARVRVREGANPQLLGRGCCAARRAAIRPAATGYYRARSEGPPKGHFGILGVQP